MSLKVIYHISHSSFEIEEEKIEEKVELLVEILKRYGFEEAVELKEEYDDERKTVERKFKHKVKPGLLSLLYGKNGLAVYWYEKEEAEEILKDFASALGRNLVIKENPQWCF
ncbi:MAG: hypothetical protein QXR09_00490 [Candidatus Aenigmatarchaeota archaeon]